MAAFRKALWPPMEAERDDLEVPTQDQGLSDDLVARYVEARPKYLSLA